MFSGIRFGALILTSAFLLLVTEKTSAEIPKVFPAPSR